MQVSAEVRGGNYICEFRCLLRTQVCIGLCECRYLQRAEVDSGHGILRNTGMQYTCECRYTQTAEVCREHMSAGACSVQMRAVGV